MASEPTTDTSEQTRTENTEAEPEPVLSVENLTKVYPDGTVAVDDISFTIDPGDFCVVIGPSGCGKSTTLHSIVGKIPATEGRIVLGGNDITNEPTYRRDISLVFQDFQLFPHMSVEENIYYGLEAGDIERSEADVESLMELLDINEYRDSSPRELSAGQKQRVALVRSLVLEPKLLLLDEPLGDMDYKLQKRMERELLRIHRETDTTFVYVTHDQTQAMRLGDQIVVLNGGEIEQSGTVDEVYNHPATAFVSTFVGDSNVFRGEITAVEEDGAVVEMVTDYGTFHIGTENLESAPETLIGETIPFSVRPHNFSLSETTRNTLACAVDDVIHRPGVGTQLVLTAESDGGEPKEVQYTSHERLDVDSETVTVGWEPDDAVLLERLSVLPDIDLDKDILGE